VSRLTTILAWLRRQRRAPNGFSGVFRSFEEASASVPAGQTLGYDNPGAASLYRDMLHQPRHDDYPAILWLQRALRTSKSLLEIGGHVGVAYYAFERHLAPLEGVTWTILDTKAVAEAGRQLARERGRGNLIFVSEFEAVQDSVDVLFASGSLQYVPGPSLSERVRSMPAAPRHIVINKTPVTHREGFVTLQDIGLSYCPYRIHSRAELIDPLLEMGYEVVDSWQKERRLVVPGHPERTLEHYSGFYLTRGV
jgi:putative methyltransferase (TIGR04325 family)